MKKFKFSFIHLAAIYIVLFIIFAATGLLTTHFWQWFFSILTVVVMVAVIYLASRKIK